MDLIKGNKKKHTVGSSIYCKLTFNMLKLLKLLKYIVAIA